MARADEISRVNPALNVRITIAASATSNGLEAALQVINRAGEPVAGVFPLEVWFSEDSAGIGLTADAYSGALTAVAAKGAILTALTAKKHVSAVTNAAGLLTLLVVDTAKPADQYVAVKRPLGAGCVVSAASGTAWGA